jgi:hypothetical protein
MKAIILPTFLLLLAWTTPITAQNQSVIPSQQKDVQVSRGAYYDANKNGICDNFEVYGRQGQGNGWGRGYGFRGGRGAAATQAPLNRRGLAQGQGRGLGPAYGRGYGPGKGRGLSPGGRRFVDADKNGICDLYETAVKKN